MKLVVACALIDTDGRILLAKRPNDAQMGGLWEFPGGKIDPEETPENALVRELKEELDIDTHQSCLAPVCFSSYAYPDFQILLLLYICRKWKGRPRALFASELKWVFADDLKTYSMPQANIEFISHLQDLL
ncbi:8-oxo-dGTP diphosphatase MutT [Alphaproteobacteria bacterium]|nr:8-oxo-dGTP diphosphatase MutT [Alphaproteobacteria bacterium]